MISIVYYDNARPESGTQGFSPLSPFYNSPDSLQWKILQALMKKDCPLEEFKGEMPAGAIEACNHALQAGQFTEIRIFHNDYDFIVVGRKNSQAQVFLLAIWGEMPQLWSRSLKHYMDMKWKFKWPFSMSLLVGLLVLISTLISSQYYPLPIPYILAHVLGALGGAIFFWGSYVCPRKVFFKSHSENSPLLFQDP